MYNSINVDRSLFYIDESRVNTFKELARQLNLDYELTLNGAIQNEDVWTTVFNLWLLLHPDEMMILESVEKTFFYSSNYVIYDYLKNDYHFNYIRKHPNQCAELSYIFSVHLTNALNAYWFDLLKAHNMLDIAERNKHRDYFGAHHDDYPELDIFIDDQSHFMKALVQDIRAHNTMADIVKQCSDRALSDYVNYSNKQVSF